MQFSIQGASVKNSENKSITDAVVTKILTF